MLTQPYTNRWYTHHSIMSTQGPNHHTAFFDRFPRHTIGAVLDRNNSPKFAAQIKTSPGPLCSPKQAKNVLVARPVVHDDVILAGAVPGRSGRLPVQDPRHVREPLERTGRQKGVHARQDAQLLPDHLSIKAESVNF